jgi:hypothetical protein
MNNRGRYHIGEPFFVKDKMDITQAIDLLEPHRCCDARILLTGVPGYL